MAVSTGDSQGNGKQVWEEVLEILNEALLGTWDCHIDVEYWRRRLGTDMRFTNDLDIDGRGFVIRD